jgi:protein O-mannosyl-transferase
MSTEPETATPPRPDRWRGTVPWLALAVLTAVVYAPTLGHGFVWDDHEQVVDNLVLRDWQSFPELWRHDVLTLSRADDSRSNYYRPLFFVQYLALYQLFGLDARWWHAVAVVHHLLATFAALFLLRRLGLPPPVAWTAAALFAVHPVHGESVSWIAAAFNDPPAATCLLLALAAHAGWMRTRRRRWLVAAALGYGLALCLKESALSFLLLVPVVDAWVDRERTWRARALALAPFFAALGLVVAVEAWSGWSFLVAHPHATAALELALALAGPAVLLRSLLKRGVLDAGRRPFASFAPYLAVTVVYFYVRKITILTVLGVYAGATSIADVLPTFPALFLTYVRFLVWPFGLSPSYPLRLVDAWSRPAALGGLVLALAVVAAVAAAARRRPVIGFAAAWIVACLWPAFNVRSFRPEYLVHQRYLYLGCLGFCLALAWTIHRLLPAAARNAAVLLVLAVYAASTVWHDRFWASDVALWTRVAEVDPGNPAAFDYLGHQALEEGRLADAEELLLRSIAAAPAAPYGAYNLALLRHRGQHRPQQALPLYRQAIAAAEGRLPATQDLLLEIRLSYGTCLAEAGRGDEALEVFLDLAGRPPYPPRAARNAAVLWRARGRLDRVEEVLTAALEQNPEDADLLVMLIEAYRLSGRSDAARPYFERLQRLQDPSREAGQR